MATNEYGLNLVQLKYLVIEPTLSDLGLGGEKAVTLVLGTAIAESNLNWIRQYTNTSVLTGTARGLWQIEPVTANDVYNRYLQTAKHKHRLKIINEKYKTGDDLSTQLIYNMALGAIICRVRYMYSTKPLPELNATAMAEYHKTVYNTSGGAAEVTKNIKFFQAAINTKK